MIHSVILIVHVLAGAVSFVLAPAYLALAWRGSKSMKSARSALKFSIMTTVGLGTALIATGAPIGSTCVSLTTYIVVMLALVKFADNKAQKTHSQTTI